jgi:predicted ATP-grasp superfamily ATP-dependent carboligase
MSKRRRPKAPTPAVNSFNLPDHLVRHLTQLNVAISELQRIVKAQAEDIEKLTADLARQKNETRR